MKKQATYDGNYFNQYLRRSNHPNKQALLQWCTNSAGLLQQYCFHPPHPVCEIAADAFNQLLLYYNLKNNGTRRVLCTLPLLHSLSWYCVARRNRPTVQQLAVWPSWQHWVPQQWALLPSTQKLCSWRENKINGKKHLDSFEAIKLLFTVHIPCLTYICTHACMHSHAHTE
jgi:hypothetical protein